MIAAAAGVLVPLLTLGLPTTATAAIIISAFQSYGIRPGPLLFENQSGLVWALIASLYIGNVLLLVLNLPLVGMWVKVLRIPRPYLYAGILAFAGLGAYALHFNVFDTLTLLVVGVVGFLMRRYGYPVAPMVVGGILGPMAEEQLRKSMAISQGDLAYLVHSPFAIAAYGTLALIVVTGIWLKHRKARLEASPTLVPTAAIAAIDPPQAEPAEPSAGGGRSGE
jgi:putative tricarboxylic transport membrane protein